MNKFFLSVTLLIPIIAFTYTFAVPELPKNDPYNVKSAPESNYPNFESKNTYIHHPDGSTTIIRPFGLHSGIIDYADGSRDYYR